MTEVIPGIIEKDWDMLAQKVLVVAPYTKWLHINVSDGSMGVARTCIDVAPLPELVAAYRDLSFEAHVLAANPDKFIRPLISAGFTRIIAHIECNDPRRFLDEARYEEVEVGVAMDGTTEIREVEPFIEEVDTVLVMTKEADAADGAFLPEALEKIKLLRQNYPDIPIEAVGGITDKNIQSVKDAGATRIIVSGFIFRQPQNAVQILEMLRSLV